ncbi:MAG: Uma2 family endonuclease [Chloroflexi bacterium]|nr:Uma2 family endonuclease [Chloroflexota bacterium]
MTTPTVAAPPPSVAPPDSPPSSRPAAPTRRRFTVAEYYAMAEAGILAPDERVELLDGDVIVMPPIGDWHASRVKRLNNFMLPSLQGRAIVSVQDPTRLDDASEPEPDVMLLRWRDDFYEGGHPGPADVLLLIEVSDTTVDYDRGVKLAAYAAAGIPEVWIVNRPDRRIESYADPAGDEYTTVRHYGPGETISPQAFPDAVLQVDQIIPPETN